MTPGVDKGAAARRLLIGLYKSGAGMFVVLIVMWIALSFLSPHFLTSLNLLNLLKQTVTIGFIAAGMTFCLCAGVIDLSVGSMFAMGGVVAAMLLNEGVPLLPAIAAALAVGSLFGVVYALMVAHTAIPSFVITLAAMSVVRGLSYVVTGGLPRNVSSPQFAELGTGLVLDTLPWAVTIYLATVVLLHILLRYTILGQHILATGANLDAAILSGIKVVRIWIVAFVISGCLAALAGVLSAARIMQGQPMAGIGFEADAVAAAVLGGTAFTGGRGTMIGTFIGALVLATIRNGLNLLGVSYYVQLVVQGSLIVVAVLIDTKINTSARSRSL